MNWVIFKAWLLPIFDSWKALHLHKKQYIRKEILKIIQDKAHNLL